MAGAVSWPLNRTCPRFHWKRPNMPLQENSARDGLKQPLSCFLAHIKHLAFLNMKTQDASMENFVISEHCVIFVACQRGVCHATCIFYNLTHFTTHLSLRKVTGSTVTQFLMRA